MHVLAIVALSGGAGYVFENDWKIATGYKSYNGLLYTSDAAEDLLHIDIGARRIRSKLTYYCVTIILTSIDI